MDVQPLKKDTDLEMQLSCLGWWARSIRKKRYFKRPALYL